MPSAGFSQQRDPARPFKVWVVFYFDKYAEDPQRRIAGAFTTEAEAKKLLRELRSDARDTSPGFTYTMEPTNLYKLNDNWRPDPEHRPYHTIKGLNRGQVRMEFRGYRCKTLHRITRQAPSQEPETRGLEIRWATRGTDVHLGIERTGALLIDSRYANPLADRLAETHDAASPPSAERWSSDPVASDDPLATLQGRRVHGVSVTENDDGSIAVLRLRFEVGALLVRARGDEFVIEVTAGS